jgi:Cu/Ag efflux protein CusF
MLSRAPAIGIRAAGLLCAALSLPGVMWAQAAPSVQSSVGTVTKIDAAAHTLSLKTDAGAEVQVSMASTARFRRVEPGQTSLKGAATIQFSDISVGDRVLARGSKENQSVDATLIVVMSRSDIAKKQEAERADWDKRGVTGLVTAVSPDSITMNVRTLAGAKSLTIVPADHAMVRRYAPDSVKFEDAKPSTLAAIKIGDQVRARGDKNQDGSQMTAEEIVSGTFKTIAGVVLSIDAQANTLQIRDLETKKPVTVKIEHDSSMRKLEPMLAQLIAARVHGEAAAPGGRGSPGSRGGFARGGFGGPGGGRGFGRGRGGDLQQMLERSPAITLADLKPGDAVVVSSTVGTTAGTITAITMLAGVEPILTKPGTQEMSLGSWNPGGGIGGLDAGAP